MKPTFSILVLFAACTGAHRADTVDADTDAEVPVSCGGDICDPAPAASCLDGDTLRTYTATCENDVCATPSAEVECGALGCCGDHCCAVSPSNSIELGGLQPTGHDVEVLQGTFDTSVDCTASSLLGSCTVVPRATLGEACVCRADKMRIGSLRVNGTRALVLFAHREVLVTGTLDVSATGAIDGPGASFAYEPSTEKVSGGVGGSYGSRGGNYSGTPSAQPVGTQTLVPLTGGMRGADSSGLGGGGGGALQISAGFRVDIVGAIQAGGGGGRAGKQLNQMVGAGGGGSGGAILLEAPTVIVGGNVLANGGGGGGGSHGINLGTHGWDAAAFEQHDVTVDEPALGGYRGYCTAADPYYGNGGAGANDTMPAQPGQGAITTTCSSTTVTIGGGGGGGGAGRIRINTASDCQCNGTVLPAATFGTVITR